MTTPTIDPATSPENTAYFAFCRAARVTPGPTRPEQWRASWAGFFDAARHGAPPDAAYAWYRKYAPPGSAAPAWADLTPADRRAFAYAWAASVDATAPRGPRSCAAPWAANGCFNFRLSDKTVCRRHLVENFGWWRS